jgi:hypothetical protein
MYDYYFYKSMKIRVRFEILRAVTMKSYVFTGLGGVAVYRKKNNSLWNYIRSHELQSVSVGKLCYRRTSVFSR